MNAVLRAIGPWNICNQYGSELAGLPAAGRYLSVATPDVWCRNQRRFYHTADRSAPHFDAAGYRLELLHAE